nr:hypothetical protein [Tanacetum cinerariifolium]
MQTHASKVDLSKALDADLVVMESNGTESEKPDTSSSSGNYLTHVVDYEIRVNKRQMQTHASKVDSSKALDADLVVMESNGTESEKPDTSSSSGNYLTHVVDVDIRPVNDQIPFAKA